MLDICQGALSASQIASVKPVKVSGKKHEGMDEASMHGRDGGKWWWTPTIVPCWMVFDPKDQVGAL